MKKIVLLMIALLAFYPHVKGDEYDFKTFKLGVSPHSGAFSVSMKGRKLTSGMLFLNGKTAGSADGRFFQNSSFVQGEISPKLSRDGKNIVVSINGIMQNNNIEATIPFSQIITVLPDGTLKFKYELEIPESFEFQDRPRLLATIGSKVVAGKGIWQKNPTSEGWKVVGESYSKKNGLIGNKLSRLKIATDFGALDFSPLIESIHYHDTRAYQQNGPLRIDVLGKKETQKWKVAFTLKMPVDSVEIPSEVLAAELADFKPDFKDWDIYLPHLNRTHLSGWWKLKLLPKTEDNPANDRGTAEKFYASSFDDSKWENMMVPGDWHRPFMVSYKKTSKFRRGFSGVGWYRLQFDAPAVSSEERAILHFDEVVREADIFLNGKKVGRNVNYRFDGMHTTWEGFDLDVTDTLIPGQENVLAVRVYGTGKPISWGRASLAGISGQVYLDVKPSTYAKDILITTENDLESISYDCYITGPVDDVDDWSVEVFEWDTGEVVAEESCDDPAVVDGKQVLSGEVAISDPKLWSCESPYLYGFRLKNDSGKVTGIKRFGMRTFQAKNGHLLLNGKPTMLRGKVNSDFDYSRGNHKNGYLFVQNEGGAFKRYFKVQRDANINHIRFHSSTMSPTAYNVFDELGILITDELCYPYTSIKNPKDADKISIQGIDFASNKDGSLRPEFVEYVKKRMAHLYSHPSIATFSFGNEMRKEGQCGKMFNNLYDLYKSIDKQNRPLTPSSGRFWKGASNMESLSKIDKLDYIDTHDYTGSLNNFPVSFCEPVAKHFIKETQKYYKDKFPPIINGETLFFQDHYYSWFYDEVWESEHDAEPNWEKYLWVLTELEKKSPAHRMMSYYWVRNWGTRNYKYNQVKGRAIYTERTLEVQRKLWPDLDGFEMLSGSYFSKATPDFPLSEANVTPNEAYDPLKQVCAPAVVVLDYIAPNRYSGEKVSVTAHAINNSEKDLKNSKLTVVFLHDGKEVNRQEVSVGYLAQGEKKKVEFSVGIPEAKGAVEFNYILEDDGQVLCDRKLEMNIKSRAEVFAPIATNKKVLVYDAVEKVFTGMGRANTTKLLKQFELPFTSITNFDRLPADAILIIGANSIDTELEENAEKIKAFLDNGGRVLVFEQSRMGRIPFLRELEYAQAGSGQFAEKIRQYHPAINEMSQNEFLFWNQKDWSVYHSFVAPLSEAAVLVGGDSTPWGADNFGMVVSHLKVGKGTMLLSQADVTPLFEKDSSAALLARKLILTVLDDKAVKEARKYRGNPVIVKPLPKTRAVYIPLDDAANMGFADHKAGDGKGGWTDQGARNDLHQIPTGENVLDAVSFNITNPASNGGKSCIVVSANKSLSFKSTSAPVAVGKKLKRLVFLHTGAWIGNENTPAGKYVVKYSSGKSVEIPLVVGQHIADWWNAPSKKLTKAQCVWSANNGSSVVGAYAYSWTNSNPDEEIASISVESYGNTVIGLLAISGEAR